MNNFKLNITAYNRIIYNGSAVYCGVETQEGSLGFKARHEPVLAILKEGSLIHYRDSAGTEKSVHIEKGMLSFKNNECTITVGLAAGKMTEQ